LKPKLLFILHLPPPIHGAALVSGFIKQSKRINLEFNCQYIDLSTSRSLNQIGDFRGIKFFRYLRIIVYELWHLIFFRPDVVYITLNAKGIGFYKDSIIALIAKAFSKKVVYHFHNKGVSENQNNYFDNCLYKLVFRNSDVIILSKKLFYDISKYKSLNQVHVCPNGIPDFVNQKLEKQLHIDSSPPVLLFFSNLIISKGVLILLDACALLKNKGIDFKCFFVGGIGDISEFSFRERVLVLNLEKHVEYFNGSYGNDKYLVYQKADLFVFPTYYHNEAFPLVNLEAMQCSLPIISTDVGAISDIVEDSLSGFLVPPFDVNLLAEKIEILIKDPNLRKKMGRAGRIKYEEQFTFSHFENNFINILYRIA
jgi:glycosyltransferase involved in cell wall biosynthesis